MTRIVLLLVSLFSLVGSAQTAAPLFELLAPTGRFPIGTTRWVVTDASRDETFAAGRKRDVEIIAWYPAGASGASGAAPYMRDGMEEALAFGRLAKVGDAWNGLAAVKTHAVIDAAPASTPARFPVIVFQHGYTGLP